MKNDKVYEAAVIGGGVCGAAIAYHLAKAGVSVALLEKGDICSGTSGTNPGFCVLTYREDPALMDMALEQRLKWADLSAELVLDLEYEETGGLIPLGCERELEILTGLADNARSWGLKEVEIVSPRRAVQQEPALDPAKVIGALYCPWEGKINPFRLTIGLARKARELGADIFTGTKVTGMEVLAGQVKAILTPRGRIRADLVICAAGAWSREVAAMAGASLPVQYERGEAMVSISVPPMGRGIVTDGQLFVLAQNRPEMTVGGCLGQTASGNIVLAQATTNAQNYDCSATYQGPRAVARRVRELFPPLKDLEILRMWAGVIAFMPDRRPLFGFLQNPSNFLALAGFHSAIGIAPVLGRILPRDFLKGSARYDVSGYSPLRFGA